MLPALVVAADLRGVIDVHVHSAPDVIARSLDAVDAVRLAKAAGLRAIVLKNHCEPTASWAYFAGKAVPGIEVFGGIALNRPVGGVNPAAVSRMARLPGGRGKIVWMPTFGLCCKHVRALWYGDVKCVGTDRHCSEADISRIRSSSSASGGTCGTGSATEMCRS